MTPPLLLDLSHTSHTRAHTGVQRVARSLWRALGDRARPICHDPYLGAWRALEAWELATLRAENPAARRGARWPWRVRWRRLLRRGRGPVRLDPADLAGGLLAPEIFSPAVAAAQNPLFAEARGPRAALFHDAIALRLPELTPARTVARFPSYLRELLAFDGIAAISEDSRQSLLDYWRWLGAGDPPPVVAIPLGLDPPRAAADPADPAVDPPTVLCVASIEGRKNHAALLDACESLWGGGARFHLRLVGLAQRQTAAAAIARIAELQRAGRPLQYDGPVDQATLDSAYRQCAFTVYPSLEEGFGLPVQESLAHGRPCLCSAKGALGEAARGGGCLALPAVDAPALAGAIAHLLANRQAREELAASARARRFKTWSDYAQELWDWMSHLPRRRQAAFTKSPS